MKLFAVLLMGGVGLFLLFVLVVILLLIGVVGWAVGSALLGPVGGFLTAALLIGFFLAIGSEAVS